MLTLKRSGPGVAILVLSLFPWLGIAAPAQAAVVADDRPPSSWRLNGVGRATAIVGNIAFVGGSFSTATSPGGEQVTRRRIAAFELDTGNLVRSWRVNANSTVRALVTDGTWLYVGGNFSYLGGRRHNRLARINVATFAVDHSFNPSFNGAVRALALDGNALYAGGTFTSASGQSKRYVARLLLPSGNVDPAFNVNPDNVVWGLARNPVNNHLYLSGRFSTINGNARTGVGAVDALTGNTTGPAFERSARPTLGLDVNPTGTRLYGAGGSGTNSAAAWNVSNGNRIWRVVTEGDIQAIAYHAGTVFFGFHDGYRGDSSVKLLSANAETGVVDPFRPSFNRFWGVYAISVTDDGMAVGGDFTRVSGVPAQGWVRFPVTII